MATLIVAEKNKAAKAIAEALGIVKSIKRNKYLYIYHIPSKGIYVLPLRGHILENKNTERYKSWSKTNPRNIITDPDAIVKVPKSYAKPYINALVEYGKLCDEVIIATDCDCEGVNIGLFDAFPFVKQGNPKISLTQMWLSSLQKSEITQKFKNTIPPKWSWGEAAEARAKVDAIIGFSATREITNTLKPLLNQFNKRFTSIGRVQTSLLYLIYLREERIKNFVPEQYYTIDANLINNLNSIKVYHQFNPFKSEEKVKALEIFQKIKDEKIAKIVSNVKNSVIRTPPTPLNTSKALVLLTKNLKISANLALNTMNSLYLNKIISYPRTDSDVYKSNFGHLEFLKKFVSNSNYGKYTSNLLKENRTQPTKGKKDAGDHPPITPLESLEDNSSRFENDLQKKVYNLLVRHYLALFGKNAKESKTVLKLLIKDEPFIGRYVSLISEGFFEIVPFLKPKYDSDIKIVGDKIPVEKIFFNEKETQPPPRFTDTSLLKLMERNGLGTKSTRPLIIQLLQNRGLIYRNKRQYICSELGTFLIDNLKDIWLPFLEPKFTRFIEELLEDIKDGKKKMEEVVDIVKNEFLNLFDKFRAKKIDLTPKVAEFEKKIKNSSHERTTKKGFPLTTSMCPFCRTHPMKLVSTRNKKRFLACLNENCEKKYLSVPKRGKITILNSKCAICNFNIFRINAIKNNRRFNYYICPKCWNDGLKINTKEGFCSACKDYKIINDSCIKN